MISKVAVIGAGTMGNGIAHLFALHGFIINLVDVDSSKTRQALDTIAANLDRQVAKGTITTEQKKNTLNLISSTTELAAGVSGVDLIIEAATENEDIKKSIFRQLDQQAPATCILATNTSSISIASLAAVTGRPSRVIGMHIMNPVPVMKLVEVIRGKHTDPDVTNEIVSLSRKMDKIPCVVNDYPGFIANRILMPMVNESITALQDGVAGVREIDTIMKLGMAHPMGPLQLADFIGLDVCLAILNVLHEGLGKPHYIAAPLLVTMVQAGELGKKSGKGFYLYGAGSNELTVNPRFEGGDNT